MHYECEFDLVLNLSLSLSLSNFFLCLFSSFLLSSNFYEDCLRHLFRIFTSLEYICFFIRMVIFKNVLQTVFNHIWYSTSQFFYLTRVSSSVTIWIDYLFNIWPFSAMKFAQW